jgi:uncharacterized membrane protein (TIGR02234 family)
MAERRRSATFGPTVVIGPAAAVLAAVAASRDWATASGSAAGVDVTGTVKGSSTAPLAVALALVALAAWGVVLVLRGRVRRAVAVVGALAAAGIVAAALSALQHVRDDAAAAVAAKGGTGEALSTSLTGWYWVCVAAALVCVAAFIVAVVSAPRWPEMGTRYDAPAARASATSEPESAASEQDMWRALDQGHDPTD